MTATLYDRDAEEVFATHSPGPWAAVGVYGSKGGKHTRSVWFDDGVEGFSVPTVATAVGRSQAEADANARLIAAAPDLLQALKVILSHQGILGAVLNAWKKEPGGQDKARLIFGSARAAVNKATGD